jgi:thiamine biosynthesis protein ThiC
MKNFYDFSNKKIKFKPADISDLLMPNHYYIDYDKELNNLVDANSINADIISRIMDLAKEKDVVNHELKRITITTTPVGSNSFYQTYQSKQDIEPDPEVIF